MLPAIGTSLRPYRVRGGGRVPASPFPQIAAPVPLSSSNPDSATLLPTTPIILSRVMVLRWCECCLGEPAASGRPGGQDCAFFRAGQNLRSSEVARSALSCPPAGTSACLARVVSLTPLRCLPASRMRYSPKLCTPTVCTLFTHNITNVRIKRPR